MRRREFVAGGIALAAGAAALPARGAVESAPARRIERIIDVHCHVFNAADPPIEGFARKIMVPTTAHTSELLARFAEYPGALEALVHAISVQVKRGAPKSQEGIDAIDEFERGSAQEAYKRMAQRGGSQTTAQRVSAHLVQLG